MLLLHSVLHSDEQAPSLHMHQAGQEKNKELRSSRVLREWELRASGNPECLLYYVYPVRALLVSAFSEELQTYLHLTDSLERSLMLGKIEGRRRRGRQTD